MADYKNKQIDFLANAQYPIFMRQPSQNDQTLKSLFGVSGNALNELKAELTKVKSESDILGVRASFRVRA